MNDLQKYQSTQEKIVDAMEALEGLPPSRGRSMTQTKLDEALMWLRTIAPSEQEAKSEAPSNVST